MNDKHLDGLIYCMSAYDTLPATMGKLDRLSTSIRGRAMKAKVIVTDGRLAG